MHIGAVTLVVRDYDEAIAFYVGALGFDLLEDSDLGAGKRWVRVAPSGAQTCLLLARATTPTQEARVGDQTGGRVGFFLHSVDFGHDHATMMAKGVCFLEAPRREPYGMVAVFVDPFGNKWDLLERRA
jgi:catechol 2,3-dioxygenase-like lactoylglutathione lyase family enzyme